MIHGTLHLVGFDDTTGPQQDTMRARQTEILATFGLCPQYAERTEDQANPNDPTTKARHGRDL